MKILHITEDYSHSSGGLRTAVKNLHLELLKSGWKSFILTSKKEVDDKNVLVVKSKNKWHYSGEWKKLLKEFFTKNEIDLLHIHGVWMYPQYCAALFANKNNIPWVFSPHGMYEPWLWTQGTLKKRFYFRYISKPVFKKASCFHAITIFEKENLETLFQTTQIRIIPNLVYDSKIENDNNENDKKYLLYIGRLDKKKGIDLLIEAFKSIENTGFTLKIAGAENNYKNELKKLVRSLGLENSIKFLGHIDGKAKQALYKNAFFLVYPSHSEAIGLVNLEAAIQETPVLTTFETGLPNDWNEQGGFLIHPELNALKEKLEIISNITWEERNTLGKKIRQFVIENYSWEEKIDDWLSLYSSLK